MCIPLKDPSKKGALPLGMYWLMRSFWSTGGFRDRKKEHSHTGAPEAGGPQRGEIPGRHPQLSFMCFLQELAARSERKEKGKKLRQGERRKNKRRGRKDAPISQAGDKVPGEQPRVGLPSP